MYIGVKNAIKFELESLDHELNRMIITDSEKELRDMFNVAIERVITLRNLNMKRLFERRDN